MAGNPLVRAPLDETVGRLVRLLKDRGRLRSYAPWHLVAYERASAHGLAELQGGDIVLTPRGRQVARRIFGEPVSGPGGPTDNRIHWRWRQARRI